MAETNLLIETSKIMKYYNKAAADIAWIGGENFYVSIEDFFLAAKETKYDNGFGGQEVARDLVIVFKDGSWLSRSEYDGSEWWKYNKCPQKPNVKRSGNTLRLSANQCEGYCTWSSLKEMND